MTDDPTNASNEKKPDPSDEKNLDLLDLKEYLKVTIESAQRTRWITIVLVIATVIIGIGFYNSTQLSWAKTRPDSLRNVENFRVNNSVPSDAMKPLLDARFGSNDFENFKNFACMLNSKNRNPALSTYLLNQFNSQTIKLLEDECSPANESKAATELLSEVLIGDLNIILKDKFLYSKERFGEMEQGNLLREETKNLLRMRNGGDSPAQLPTQSPAPSPSASPSPEAMSKDIAALLQLKDSDLLRLNRMLLEDAYPALKGDSKDGILISRDIIPDNDADRARQFAIWGSYFDNVFFIRIPFFGATIDVNDLGTIGGISLIIILILMRFSLSRQIKNLNVSFRKAFQSGQLPDFYSLLAMGQVLTVPEMEGEIKNQPLSVATKYVSLLPSIVLFFGVAYDYYTVFYQQLFSFLYVKYQLPIEFIFLIFVIYLSARCLERQIHIDEIWEDYYCLTKESPKRLLHESFKDSGEHKLNSILNNRYAGKSIDTPEESRFPNSSSRFIRGLGKWWFMKLFTMKNFARLIPSKPVAFRVSKIPFRKLLLAVFICLFIVSIAVYLSIAVYSEELASFGSFISKKFESLTERLKFKTETFVLISIIITGIGVFSTFIFNLIKDMRDKRKEEEERKKDK